MKTLHSIFHEGLIKTWAIIYLISIVLATLVNKKVLAGSSKFIVGITVGYVFLSPFVVFLRNLNFSKNINWLINNNFNRKELIQFHFMSIGLRLSLFTLHILTYYVVIFKDRFSTEVPSYSLGSLEAIYLYTGLFIFFFIFCITSLASANRLEVLRHNQVRTSKLNWRYLILLIIGYTIFSYLFEDRRVPTVLILYFICAVAAYISVWIFNRAFKVFTAIKSRKVASTVSAICLIPAIVISISIRSDAHNKSLDLGTRVESISLLGSLSGNFVPNDQRELLTATKSINGHSELLDAFKGQISLETILSSIRSEFHVLSSLESFTRMREEELLMTLDSISSFRESHGMSNKFDNKTNSFLKRQRLNRERLVELLYSSKHYKNHASIVIASSSLKFDDYKGYMNDNKNQIDRVVQRNNELKKWIKETEK